MRRDGNLTGRPSPSLCGYLTVLLVFAAFVLISAGCAGQDMSSQSQEPSDSAGRGDQGASSATSIGQGSMPGATVGVAELEDTEVQEDDRSAPPVASTRFDPGPEFVADTTAYGGSGSAADTLLSVRHGIGDGYERVVLDLGVGAEEASVVPKWTLDTPEDDGLMRIYIPSARVTQVSDGKLGDGFLGDFHVVRAPEGGLFVDIFSREAFSYRTLDLGDPARLVVDFRGADRGPVIPLPESGGNTVLIEPRTGARVNDPLTVSGYSRNFEANNVISVLNSDGEIVTEKRVQSNDWSTTWGYFETTVDLPEGFSGEATLRVGARSARDGSFEGAEVPVFVS